MDSENSKQNHEKSIALIMQDIGYIKKDILKITNKIDATDTKLDAVLNHYIQREEFNAKLDAYQHQLDSRIEGLHARLAEKLDVKEFEPYKQTLTKINWTILSAVILGLLALIGLK